MRRVLSGINIVKHLISDGGEILGKLRAISIPAVKILFQRLFQNRIQSGWQVRIEIAHRRGVHIDNLVDQGALICGAKWQPPGQQLEQQHSK